MQQYYNLRALEYENIYQRDDPVRQTELSIISDAIREAFTGRKIMEVACGTGFWTKIAVEVADKIVAIDSSQEMLTIAREKWIPHDKVEFRQGDAYQLSSVPGDFDAGLSNFWFSHVPKIRIEDFLTMLHKRLGAGAIVFMADNVYIPGIGGKLVSRSGSEDTFKLREISDGTKHEVLKNYYSFEQLHEIFAPRVQDLRIKMGECFWWINYVVSK